MAHNRVSPIFNDTSPPKVPSQGKEKESSSPGSPVMLENYLPGPPVISEKSLIEEEYDPHAFGKERNPTIFWGPILHLLKYIVGTGVLILPYTFKSVGYAVAIFGTIFVCVLYMHVIHLLFDVEYRLCKKLKTPNLTYIGIVEGAFDQGPRFFRKLVPVCKFFVYFHYVFNKSLMNGVYLIIISSNFKIVIDHYYGTNTSVIAIMTALMVPLIGLALIRELKFLVPLSMLTNAFNIFNLLIILSIPSSYNGAADMKAVNDITQFPNFFAILLGSLECTALSLPVKNDMENPKRFTTFFGVLNISLSIAALVYGTFGILGYAKYGDHLQPNIMFNLPPGEMIPLVILSLHSLAICISFILFIYISYDTVWNNLFKGKKMKRPLVMEYSIRITLCILPYCFALVIPDFKLLLSLTNVIGILMDEGIPPILHMLLLVKKEGQSMRFYLSLLKDIAIVLICFCLFVAALVDVVKNILAFYV
ncbi:proton-coupled amino acid transporter-like protein pathetic [Planococcus citri]|uniref:proton-coupled amino acid transporter-like protein pathetic n=1 Tax=Planococcus citri TaxID=170843 RepID=UPI0031F823D3